MSPLMGTTSKANRNCSNCRSSLPPRTPTYSSATVIAEISKVPSRPCRPQVAPASGRPRISYSLRSPPQVSYSLRSPPQVSYSLRSPPQVASGASGRPRRYLTLRSPPQVSYSLRSPPQVSYSLRSPPQVSYSLRSPPQVSYSLRSPPQVFDNDVCVQKQLFRHVILAVSKVQSVPFSP